MQSLGYDNYAENLNTNFRVAESETPLDIELAEVKQSEISGVNEAFSLIFRSGKDVFLPQGVYNLTHESLGGNAIFLVPVGEDESGYLYEAVFNRLKK